MESTGPKPRAFSILHFNDVYNLQEREIEPVGGASRFITAAESFRHKNPLVLFSGDIFSPSTLGSITKGKHMIPFFENFKIDAAMVGNHDFDYGIERFVELKEKSGCPWLFTNVFKPRKLKTSK